MRIHSPKSFILCHFYSGGVSSGIYTGPFGDVGVIVSLQGPAFNI
jgi:hypothetical protein